MKKTLLLLIAMQALAVHVHAACSTCGSGGGAMSIDAGPSFSISMGTADMGLPAGELFFGSSIPSSLLFTPVTLQFSGATLPDVIVVTNTVISACTSTDIVSAAVFTTTTNIEYGGSYLVATDYVTTVTIDLATNLTTAYITNITIRQVNAPQALADVPTPPTANGFVINFYYPSQVGAADGSGVYAVSGTPFATWMVTNTDASSFNQLQVYETTPTDGLLKEWFYTYSTNTGTWVMNTPGGIQKSMTLTNLDANDYQVLNTMQYSNGPVVQQTRTTYEIFSWGVAPISIASGSDLAPEITTKTYWDPSLWVDTTVSSPTLLSTNTHPDGSWEYYADYDENANPKLVYSSFGDAAVGDTSNGRETDYYYDPSSADISGSGDDGTLNPNTPRLIVQKIQGYEVSRSYTVFPAANQRLNIQCVAAGARWNDAGNLITTNFYYTSGPNQFALQSVFRPDGTMTAYNYITNGAYRTNIIVTGQPDPTGARVVNGVSNVVVLNYYGYNVLTASYDVLSGTALSRDAYTNFDNFGRPQQVSHLDGTTETMFYACCGLENTVDRDGINTVYLYDTDKRQYGYQSIYSSGTANTITHASTLDAVGRAVQSYRVGSDDSLVISSQSAYDLAGELIAQTNALSGVTTYGRSNDGTTGGLIRTTINPDAGTVTNFYYADGYLKRSTGSAAHGKGYGYGVEYSGLIGAYAYFSAITNLKSDGTASSEWTKTYTDNAGRTAAVLYADGSYSQSFYNGLGQLSKQIDPDGVTTLYQYNGKGELAYTVVDLNQDGNVNFSGSDRIQQTTNDVIYDSTYGTTVRRSRNYMWLDGSSTGTLVSSTETSTNGLDTWQTQYRDSSTAVTTHSHTVPGVSRTVTITAPDGSYTVNVYSYGRLASSTRYDSGMNQIGSTIYGYDAHGRQNTMTDARDGTTTLGFNNADLVATNTTPNPGGGSPEITITAYNNMLQAISVTQPDATVVNSVYLLTGELGLQYGSRTYPVGYGYDYAGRLQTMTNWSNYSGGSGARVTTWNYDSQRGWLTSKAYADGNGPSYTYTAAGRLASRSWVRGVTTSYAYDFAGGLTNIVYSDATPCVTNSYDRLGRLNSIICNGMTDTLSYNLANELLVESFAGGVLDGLSVTNSYDQYLRRTNLTALASGVLNRAAYGYDNASRLASVTDAGDNDSASYSYLANSPLVSQIVFKQSSTTRMTTTKTYDYLNRLTQISSAPSAGLASTFNYNYNAANQRTHNTLADGSYWVYGYDSLGQVTNACKYFADGTPVAGQQFDYTFDTIGNRTQTQAGGDSTGANLRTANYTNNTLNQITSRDVPAYVDVMGASILSNTVSVNSSTAYRKEEYYRQQIPANNSSSALWTNIIVSGGMNVTGNVYVAKTPEIFSYDADGNLTNDGRWIYTWDGENRLIQMTVNTNVGPQYQLTFAYDAKGRRIQKLMATNGVALSTNNFLYDGWNLIAETRPDNSLIRSYVWGTDLSGTSQGAGGVGGLLEISYYGSSTTNCFPAYDGNGNIMALVNAADGTVAANYDYAAFGEPIRITGAMARNNPFRFSTKYADDESDLLYYGYRFYKPSTGTWLNRDPFKERGGLNLYCFAANDPIEKIDFLGKNYYVITEEGACGVHHRALVGDDGHGNSYIIEIIPVVKTWYQEYRRFCGKGEIDYVPHTGSATNWTSGAGIIGIETSVTTTSDQDADMASKAKSLDGKTITYCLAIQDCRSIEACTTTGKTLSERLGDELWQDAAEAGGVYGGGGPVGF
jgi:RHS repeat-associated protein